MLRDVNVAAYFVKCWKLETHSSLELEFLLVFQLEKNGLLPSGTSQNVAHRVTEVVY